MNRALAHLVLPIFLILLALSCTTPKVAPGPVTVDAARHIVGLYIGHHAWEISFDSTKDVVKDGVLYYSVTLGATGEATDPHYFVSSQTGDIYKPSLTEIEQTAKILLANDLADFPADLLGRYVLDKDDPLSGEIVLKSHGFSMGDAGSVLDGTADHFQSGEQDELSFSVSGTLDEGQDESHTQNSGTWEISIVKTADGIRLESIDDSAGGLKGYAGQEFLSVKSE